MMPAVEKSVKETSCWKMRNDGSDRETIPDQNHRVGIMMKFLSISDTHDIDSQCSQKNTFCGDIHTAEGYTFLHHCPKGSELHVTHNQTKTGFARLGTKERKYSKEVISVDNQAVVTRKCQDVQVKCIVVNGKSFVNEICVNYKTIEKLNPDSTGSPTSLIIIASVGVALVFVLGLYCHYRFWKKKQHGTDCGFCRYLQTCCCRGTGETRQRETPSLDQRGAGENDAEHESTLESVLVPMCSIDPQADAMTQSLNPDHNQGNGGIQPTKNGDVNAPEVNRASDHQAVNSLRDDPEEGNDNKGGVFSRREQDAGRGPEDHGDEEEQLLLCQRAANQGLDMTGEAEDLVDKPGFDPDQVSRCSTAPDVDVESPSKQHEELQYS